MSRWLQSPLVLRRVSFREKDDTCEKDGERKVDGALGKNSEAPVYSLPPCCCWPTRIWPEAMILVGEQSESYIEDVANGYLTHCHYFVNILLDA